MSSIIKVDTIQDQDGNNIINENANTVTVGKAGDTVNIVGTLQNNGAELTGDISSVVAGTGLSGGGTTGDVTLNIEAAQPTITSTGTLAGFTSTGIDDNATSTAITIDSSENVGIGTSSPQEKLDIDGNIAISGNTLFEEVVDTAGMPSSGGNKSVNTAYDSTFSLTAGKWLILVNASLQIFQSSSNESGLYLLSLSLGSSAGADDYGYIEKAVLKWGNGSNSYGDNSGGHFPTLTLGSTTTIHTRWYVSDYGIASNFWVRGNLTRIRCIRIG